MAVIRLAVFAGENRALHPKLLPDAVGVVSRNQKPGRGDLRPWKAPTTVASVPGGRKTIYRMGRDVDSDSQYWLSWTGVVHAVRGFDAEDASERTYFTGNGDPKVTDNNLALSSAPYPTASRALGLPGPVSAPLIGTVTEPEREVVTPGRTEEIRDPNTGDVIETIEIPPVYAEQIEETRFYVFTLVNDWGWESAPSPPSAQVDCAVGSTVQLNNLNQAPSGSYNVNRVRVYRTQSSSSGGDFYFVGEAAYGSGTFTDTTKVLGETLPTTSWLPPPSDLSRLTALWNGMLAGISKNAVRFCEANVPYAWPVAYNVVPPDSKPVALGVFGQALLVLTTGKPLLVTGSSPESMDQQPLEIPQGCIAPQSVVSMGTGVAWASEDGLCWYGAGGARILTAGVMRREDWQAIKPSTVIGCMYEGLYFGSYDDGSGRKGFLVDPSNPQGIYFMDKGYSTLYFDTLKDQLYVLDGTNIQKWDSGTPMTYRFRSKEFRLPKPSNLASAEVMADSYPVTVRVFADGELRHTQTVTSSHHFRLPSGFLALTWQFEIEGAAPVQWASFATSNEELSQV